MEGSMVECVIDIQWLGGSVAELGVVILMTKWGTKELLTVSQLCFSYVRNNGIISMVHGILVMVRGFQYFQWMLSGYVRLKGKWIKTCDSYR